MESEGFDLELIGDCDLIMSHFGRAVLDWDDENPSVVQLEQHREIKFVKQKDGLRTYTFA
jgi:hypothetical protein